MKEHKYQWLSTNVCNDRFDDWIQSFYWCENCGIVKKVIDDYDNKDNTSTVFYIPKGYGSKPNSQECIDEVK
jgi:hypothetical protein